MLLSYLFMELGSHAKLSKQSSKEHQLWGQRIFLNMHEQSTLFLVSLWCHAVFSSKEDAATLGYMWLACRAIYPWIWMWNGKFKIPDQILSTMPQYSFVLYMMGSTVLQYKYNFDVKEKCGGLWMGVLAFCMLFNLAFVFCGIFSKFIIEPNFFIEKPSASATAAAVSKK